MSDKTRILFLSTDNAARSQMAAAFAESFAAHLMEASSAGVEAAEAVHPYAVKVMNEDWLDISGETPKAVTDAMLADVDLVITLSEQARDRCPALPQGAEHRHWEIDDPKAAEGDEPAITNAFRSVQDDVKEQILFLMNELRGAVADF